MTIMMHTTTHSTNHINGVYIYIHIYIYTYIYIYVHAFIVLVPQRRLEPGDFAAVREHTYTTGKFLVWGSDVKKNEASLTTLPSKKIQAIGQALALSFLSLLKMKGPMGKCSAQ